MGSHNGHLTGGKVLRMSMTWIYQGGIFFLLLMVETVSGMDPGSGSISNQISRFASQLSTLGSQLIQLQEQVEVLQQENMEDKQRIVHLEQVTEEFESSVSLLESVCGSSEMGTEISGEEEVTISTNVRSISTEIRPLMAIGGYKRHMLSSAEVLNTSCDFPLPQARWGHIGLTTTDGKTLVCGGGTSSSRWAESCLQFDYESKSWKEHSVLLSTHRTLASAVTLSRGSYVLGGEDDAKSSSEFLATGSSVWTQGPQIPGDGVHDSCVAKLSDTEFLILGGGSDGTQALVYNEEQNTWRISPSLSVGVSGHSCVGLGDIVLIAGGYTGEDSTATRRTIIFDTKTGLAREVASLKYPRLYADMVLYGGHPVILGGQDDEGNKKSDGEMWNMDTETWEEADIHLNIGRDSLYLVTLAEDIDCD